ncbi:MAG: tRNA (adenosine(37)-N6)-threonylcarbamoyltransferase complex dimerization subunit type 1 TsaB [Chloroflexota bacterium]
MALLAIDTSGDEAAVAVAGDDRVLEAAVWTSQGNHSSSLMPAIARLLRTQNIDIDQIDRLVVAIGPGSFSGIRVGLAAGKGLALALSIPLVGVSTLDAIAAEAATASTRVWALMPAGRGRLYAARYDGNEDIAQEYLAVMPPDLAERIQEDDVLVGEGAPLLAQNLQQRGKVARMVETPGMDARVGHLVRLGRRRLLRGEGLNWRTLEPLYLRRSSAEEKRAESLS